MSNRNALVSIITPCYNSEEYVERYIDTILQQTYDRIQLIFVNDGSTDQTEALLLKNQARIEERGYVFTYVYQQNKGLGGAINTGLQEIRGDYFTWCDSDNFYTNDYIESKVTFFEEHPQYSVVRCDGYVVEDSDLEKPISKMADGNTDLYREELFENCLMVHNFHFGCAMLRTKDFDEVNPNRTIYPSRAGQNWQLLLPMFYRYKSGYIDKPMFYFVIRKDSISNITQYQGVDKKIEKLNEYVRILTETLNSMDMSEEERANCLKKVAAKYSKQRFYVYVYAYDADNAEKEYAQLEEYGQVDKRLKLAKWRCKHRRIDKVIRVFRK